MTLNQISPLVDSVSRDIIRLIQENELPPGTRLVERKLGEDLKVSRSPIRRALQELAAKGAIAAAPTGGYLVAETSLPPYHDQSPADGDEPYYRLADERLNGSLPDRVTETFLLDHLGLTRTELNKLLLRASNEGWIARLPGYGWEFQPMLNNTAVYRDSYRFRLVLEPNAILEPTFVLDRDKLLKCREVQQRLIDGNIWHVSNAELFDANAHLHETIMNCSRNSFFSDALQKVDKLRRLIEYKKSLPRDRALERCKEHVKLIDLLLAGNLETAASYMREHLTSVSSEKTAESH
ncbi:GntR family transcriptional regulator [Arthrobacter sp. NIO-1057]|uniref:GntR family transcriptional regulator n=1 Tax=Arthrobacter sp. NIO-1057 TaxID=993071 RepID=UPI00071E6584|nr:GntR family transcriptional regulator [Arthrobacter sp. NIO-1057]KSU66684.1 GntR family transcriptional regulator [Arthrobacter sp. NIO-1057]SCC21186.1 DNA-binding transcriptional regulator, GntR family [Arthrobacter sp. NIO-1057]